MNGEDNYTASRRGEDTSRLEAKLESQMEGMHAEDHPELVGMIKRQDGTGGCGEVGATWPPACAAGASRGFNARKREARDAGKICGGPCCNLHCWGDVVCYC